jgi:hypothetical protein
MTREARLLHCELCKKRKLNFERGLLCSLTDDFATFEGSCSDFELDVSAKKSNTDTYSSNNNYTSSRSNNYNEDSGIGFKEIFWGFITILAIVRLIYRFSQD